MSHANHLKWNRGRRTLRVASEFFVKRPISVFWGVSRAFIIVQTVLFFVGGAISREISSSPQARLRETLVLQIKGSSCHCLELRADEHKKVFPCCVISIPTAAAVSSVFDLCSSLRIYWSSTADGVLLLFSRFDNIH